MNFKAWFTEWEGFAHIGSPGKNGEGNYGDVGPQSKYNGHGAAYGQPRLMQGDKNIADELYGFKRRIKFKRMNKKG